MESPPASPLALRISRLGRRRRVRALRRLHGARWPYPQSYAPGNRVRLFVRGAPCYRAMLEAIASARTSVHLETYILRADETGWRFARALAERAAAGVEVAVLYDAVGSLGLSGELIAHLTGSGARVLAYHPVWPWERRWNLTRRTHRKILVVDGSVGFVGGMNISDSHAPAEDGGGDWRDTHLAIDGPAALKLDRLFVEEWLHQGGPKLAEAQVGRAHDDGFPIRIVENRFHRRRALVRAAYLAALAHAKERIWITNSYFLPDGRLLRALMRAARRGVDVRIVVPGRSDIRIVQWGTEFLYGRLLTAGVRIFEWTRTVLHAKTAVVDSRWITVGSYNLDHLSWRYNLEVNAMILGSEPARALEAAFESDVAASNEVRPEDLANRSPWRRLRSWIAYQLRRWL